MVSQTPPNTEVDITILRKLIAAKRIKADSPLRGPATHQLWRRVRHIPGIAHLAGVCHACGDAVKADNKFCPSCGGKFAVYVDVAAA